MQKWYIYYIWYPWSQCLSLQPYTTWSLCLYNWFDHLYLYKEPLYYWHPWWQIICISYLEFLCTKICLVSLFIFFRSVWIHGYWFYILDYNLILFCFVFAQIVPALAIDCSFRWCLRPVGISHLCFFFLLALN